jgi:heptaprenyl diphosphate synthase
VHPESYLGPVATNPLLSLSTMPGDLERVEEELRKAVNTPNRALNEMASHLIGAGGKRVRPLFAVASAACADDQEGPADLDVVRGGVAIEMVHLGSLHHDDVIDEAVTRRGVESVNARWGNLRAIISGDFLLARASEIGASLGTEIAGLLASTISQLCEGEVAELQTAYQLDRSEEAYLASIEGKTASVFSAACRIGAIVGDLPRENVERLTRFGMRYGIAFQIIDDVLDVVASDEQLGKPAGHDLVEGVYTLPVMRALDGPAGGELRELLGTPLAGAAWDRARELVRSGDAVDQAVASAESYVDWAVAELEPMQHRPAAQALEGAARHLLSSIATLRAA